MGKSGGQTPTQRLAFCEKRLKEAQAKAGGIVDKDVYIAAMQRVYYWSRRRIVAVRKLHAVQERERKRLEKIAAEEKRIFELTGGEPPLPGLKLD